MKNTKDERNMNSDDINIKVNSGETTEKVAGEESDYKFIQEKIKQRPLNRRKLLRKLLTTVGMAVLFGLVACISIMIIEPVIEKMIKGDDKEQITQISLPDTPDEQYDEINVAVSNIPFEETPIEEMKLEDENNGEDMEIISEMINEVASDTYTIDMEDYQQLCKEMYSLSLEIEKSLVTITSVTEDMDILNDSYTSTNRTSGLIIAETDSNIYITCDNSNLPTDSDILVTFCDGQVYDGYLCKADSETGLAVYKVHKSNLNTLTQQSYVVATFGTSEGTYINGSAVIAVGNPLALNSSVCYGVITSNDSTVNLVDGNYQLISTDIYGSSSGYGFLVNVRGQFVGIITNKYNSSDLENMIFAYGWSGVRELLENLSNAEEIASIGVKITDVTEEAKYAYGMPSGVYVTDVSYSSPAMNVGITSGDIIVGINGTEIVSSNDYMLQLNDLEPNTEITLTIYRYSGGEYKEIEVLLTTGERN